MADAADGRTTPVGKKDDAARWTVRGVPQGLQKAAGSAARAEGVPVGVWLSALLARAVADRPPPTEEWRTAVERRLTRLESVLADEKAGGKARRAASGDNASAPA